MITIKLKYNSSQEFNEFLPKLRKQYTSIFHYVYNRLLEGKTEKEIYHSIKLLNNIELMKSKMIYDCIKDAIYIYEKDKKLNHKSIFGSKKDFIKKCKGLITNEEWKIKRLRQLYIQGCIIEYGNRYFKLDLLNNQIIFKYDIRHHYTLNIRYSQNQLKELIKIQELCENKKGKYTILLSEKEINISFEPIKLEENINYIENRFIGIDMNPSYIGISILEFDKELKVLHTEMFDFKQIINENKDLNNKLNYEIFEISKRISNISKHWRCKFIFIEDLEFKNTNKGKEWNMLNNNLWKRNKFIDNLQKRCNINNQYLYKVYPAYTSFIGNCLYDYTDPINASIEIGRRGFECIILKNKNFYPVVGLKDSLIHRWKEMVNEIPGSWRDLFNSVKNLKLSYRVSLEECNHFYDVFRKNSRMVDYYQFL